MSLEFGWTPDQIDRLIFQELDHYFAQCQIHRQTVAPIDVTLEMIRRAVFAWLKIPEPKRDVVDEQLAKVSAIKVTQDEVDAWVKAGMPSPPNVFFASYRQQRKTQVTHDD